MPVNVMVASQDGAAERLRVELDMEDGRTRVWCRARGCIAEAWFCPPEGWQHVAPDTAEVRSALRDAAATFRRLEIEPAFGHPDCEDDAGREAVG